MKNSVRLFLVAGALALTAFSGARAETISAMGRVLPASGVIDLTAAAGDTVESVLVKEGNWVDAGKPLARLASAATALQRVQLAEADLAAAEKQVAGDLALARQTLAAAEEEANVASARLKRIRDAHDSEFISPDTVEARSLSVANTQSKLYQARQDVAKAEREGPKMVQLARTELRQARAALAASEVQAPVRACVLKILTSPGLPTGRQELFKIGDTSAMKVVAEVYESDVLKVKAGQRATITSSAFGRPLEGVVQSVSRMVLRNTLQSMDPNAQVLARVVEVSIRMNDVEPLDRLVYLQVDVKIAL